jgi:hypothetical protein
MTFDEMRKARGVKANSLIPRFPSPFEDILVRMGIGSNPDPRIANISLPEYHPLQQAMDFL